MFDIPLPDQPAAAALQINPLLVRLALAELRLRGGDPQALCLGLDFTPDDLAQPGLQVSYFQASQAIRRVQTALADPCLGLKIGMRQNMLSWGLVGFGLMAARTLREGVVFGLRFQHEAGFLLRLDCDRSGTYSTMLASPKFADVAIEATLVDATFAAVVGAARQLAGTHFSPHAVELMIPRPADTALYQRAFGCPVRFGCSRNALLADKIWAGHEIATGDGLVVRQIIALLRAGAVGGPREDASSAAIETRLRSSLREPPSLMALAGWLNMGERSLRRRLADSGATYVDLLDRVRKTVALELIAHGQRSMREVADEVGFSDARSLRRAFKRWTGGSLSEAVGRTPGAG